MSADNAAVQRDRNLAVAVAALMLVAALPSPAAAQGVHMLPATRVETQGHGAKSVDAVDLDLDGHLDLLSTDGLNSLLGEHGFRVLRGLGDGTFVVLHEYQAQLHDQFAFLADVTSDGQPDYVTATYGATPPPPSVWVYPNLGGGTFGPGVETPLGQNNVFSYGAAGDFDEDGHADLVVVCGLAFPHLRTARGHGDGSFDPFVGVPGGAEGPAVVADIDLDGHLDLIMGEELSVHLGNGDGTFPFPIVNAPNSSASVLLLADLDADGWLDTVSGGSAAVRVHRGHGDGTLTPVGTYMPNEGSALDTRLADLDDDGWLDLVFCRSSDLGAPPPGLMVRRGLGGLQFGPATDYATGGKPSGIAAGDFDEDGRLDLALGQWDFGSGHALPDIAVAFGRGDGGFDEHVRVATPGAPLATELADMNSDGHLDLVTTVDDVSPAVRIALGAGDGSFDPTVGVDVGTFSENEGELAVADFNGDGAPDLLVAGNPPIGETVLALGAGDGVGFGPPQLVANSDVADVRAADFDQDGAQDFAVTRTAAGVVTVYFGDGTGGFGAGVYLSAGGFPNGMVVADLDADGLPDIAVANTDSGLVGVLINLGGRAFALHQTLSDPADPMRITAGDLDGDGIVDLATADRQPKRVSIFRGTGGGSFAPFYPVGLGRPSTAITAIDVNRDGALDLVNTVITEDLPTAVNEDNEPGSVALLLGRGDGSFLKRRLFFTGANPLDHAVGDVDEDGLPDVAAACNRDGSTWVLPNLVGPWENLGFALAAPAGSPVLTGSGEPVANELVGLLATGVPAGSPGLLFVGLSTVMKPLQGGTLVPFPTLSLPFPPQVLVTGRWSPAIPPGTPVYFQAWFVTPPGGEVAATNALLTIGE